MRKLSRYILGEFFSFLIYTIIAFAIIFILVDLVDHIDHFIDDHVRVSLVFLYYLFSLPYTIVLTLPVAMLLATMFSLGRLGGDNEIIAMKASGVSLYRILLPLYGFAFVVGLGVLVMAEVVVPRTNIYSKDIYDKGNDYRFTLSVDRELDRSNVFLDNGDGRIIYARAYSARERKASRVSIIHTVHPDTAAGPSMAQKLEAEYMLWSDGGWTLYSVITRTFGPDGERLETAAVMPAPFIVSKPADFARIELEPVEMDYFQLREYINNVGARGGDASGWLVDLYLKLSFPFVSLVIVFFGAPMAAGTLKRGKAASFGIALVIAFAFYAIINGFQVIGRNGSVHPMTAAWAPEAVFLLVGVFAHIRAAK